MAILMTNIITPSERKKDVSSFSLDNTTQSFGKYWAAIEGSKVVSLILIPTIYDEIKFNAYRDKSREALAIVGNVMTGEIQIRDGLKVFVKRLGRNNSINSKDRVEPTFQLPSYLQ